MSEFCATDGCDKPVSKRGHCANHYERLRRSGQMRPLTLEDRLWKGVDRSGGPDSCWLWTRALTTAGYGHLSVGGKKLRPAHRVAYELLIGPIPPGFYLDHMCHVPRCINPAHLRIVTNKQNAEHRIGAQANSKSGVRGVSWHRKAGRWIARVQHNGRRYQAGYFTDLDEANAAATALRNQLFTHNDHDRRAS
jgi:HNH endonuclease